MGAPSPEAQKDHWMHVFQKAWDVVQEDVYAGGEDPDNRIRSNGICDLFLLEVGVGGGLQERSEGAWEGGGG